MYFMLYHNPYLYTEKCPNFTTCASMATRVTNNITNML